MHREKRKIRHARWKMLGLIMGIAVLFSGCDNLRIMDEPPVITELEQEDLTVIGVSQVGSESVWRTENTNSVQNTFCKENGYFLIFSNARQKQENQIKSIRSFISQQVDYIIFSPIMENGWETVLREGQRCGNTGDLNGSNGRGNGFLTLSCICRIGFL